MSLPKATLEGKGSLFGRLTFRAWQVVSLKHSLTSVNQLQLAFWCCSVQCQGSSFPYQFHKDLDQDAETKEQGTRRWSWELGGPLRTAMFKHRLERD